MFSNKFEKSEENLTKKLLRSKLTIDELTRACIGGLQVPDSLHYEISCMKDNPGSALKILLRFVNNLPKIGSSNIIVFGSCQSLSIQVALEVLTKSKVQYVLANDENIKKVISGDYPLAKDLLSAEMIIIESGLKNEKIFALCNSLGLNGKIKFIPTIQYPIFHPDMDYILTAGGHRIESPTDDYHSRIVFYAFKAGLSERSAIKLFSTRAFERFGYFQFRNQVINWLIRENIDNFPPLARLIRNWELRRVCFMHSINHPKIEFVFDLVRYFLRFHSICFDDSSSIGIDDPLYNGVVWDVYPQIASAYCDIGSYSFFPPKSSNTTRRHRLTLAEFVSDSFKIYSAIDTSNAQPCYFRSSSFINIINEENSDGSNFVSISKNSKSYFILSNGDNPYKNLPSYQVFGKCDDKIRDVYRFDDLPAFKIIKDDKIVTAGSCFAKYVSQYLSSLGFNYLRYEQSTPDKFNQGRFVFSARYGNLYTARHLLQLFEESFGLRDPKDKAWIRRDGKLCDPFRPREFPEGFDNLEHLMSARAHHLQSVKRLFLDLDVLIFTLGLSELWQSKLDGSAFPVAPGVIAGGYNPAYYEWVNLSAQDTANDLTTFVDYLNAVNSKARVILSVSPIPIVATFARSNAVVKNQQSKSDLLKAAMSIAAEYANVDYFHSFELVMGLRSSEANFLEDYRTVKPDCLGYVLNQFRTRYLGKQISSPRRLASLPMLELEELDKKLCDEYELALALNECR